MTTATSLTITNVLREADAEPLRRALDGKTYMDLTVGVCPVGGSFDVVVSTTREGTTEDELRDMVLDILCSAVRAAS